MVDDSNINHSGDTENSLQTRPGGDGTSGQSTSNDTSDISAASSQTQTQPQPNTRNITLSIQYSYAMPVRFGDTRQQGQQQQQQHQQQQTPGTSTSGNNNGGTGSAETIISNNTTSSTADPAQTQQTPEGSATTGEPRLNPGPPPFQAPGGSFVLSFRDVPVSTPQPRLESIIALATELAMRRFSELTSRPKGISVQAFQSLPVLSLSGLHEKYGADFTCSICYEPFVEEKTEKELNLDDKTNSGGDDNDDNDDIDPPSTGNLGRGRRRRRNSEDGSAESERLERIKRQRTENDTTQNLTAEENDTEEMFLHSPLLLPCGHVFGRECMYKWTRLENTCPLCRHIIVENDQYQQQPQRSTVIDEGFERLRNLLYNANSAENGDATDSTSAGNPVETNRTTGATATTGSTESNSGQTNSLTTNAETSQNEFRFQTIPLGVPHIVFVNPGMLTGQTAGSNIAAPAVPETTNGSTANNTAGDMESSPSNVAGENSTEGLMNSSSPGFIPQTTMTNAGRIHWFPLSFFHRSVSSNIDSGTSPSNSSTTTPTGSQVQTGNHSTSSTDNQATPNNNLTNDNTSDGPYSRVTTILGHFFDTVAAHRRQNSNNNDNTSDNTTTTTTATTTSINGTSNTTRVNPTNFFPTGVVSFRNRNGGVTTYQLNGQGVAERVDSSSTQNQNQNQTPAQSQSQSQSQSQDRSQSQSQASSSADTSPSANNNSTSNNNDGSEGAGETSSSAALREHPLNSNDNNGL